MALAKLLRIVPSALAVAACGADQASPPAPPAGAAGQPPYDAVQTFPVSSSEHDRFLTATFDATSRLYAAGFVADGADQQMAVTRFNADGRLDAGFGAKGTATANVAKGGKAVELARGVVVQGDGKVVVAGPVEHDPAASGDAAKDTDFALARFDQAGRLDSAFGTGGIVRLDLSTGVAEGTAYRGDTVWGLTKLTGDKLLVVGSQVAPGRTDADFAVVRLNADGTKDADFGTGGTALVSAGAGLSEVRDRSFGTDGTSRVDVAGEDDRGRNLVALPDGRTILVGSGKPTAANLDAMVVTLAPGGGQTARKLYDVGGPNDAFFGVALSPDGTRVAVVGYLGRETNGGEKDDGAVLWLQP